MNDCSDIGLLDRDILFEGKVDTRHSTADPLIATIRYVGSLLNVLNILLGIIVGRKKG